MARSPRRARTGNYPAPTVSTEPETPEIEEIVEQVVEQALEPVEDIDGVADMTDDELLSLPFNELAADVDLMVAWLAAADRRQLELHRQMKALHGQINKLARFAEIVDRHRRTAEKRGPNKNVQGIRIFLQKQKKQRAERAARAQAFIAAGTTADDVTAALSQKSKLDAALSQRKPVPGSTRPAHGLPVRR